MFCFTAFGLRIQSDLEFPYPQRANGSPDVVIELGESNDPSCRDYGRKTFFDGNHREMVVSQEGLGAFHVCDGNRIVAYPAPETEAQLFVSALLRGMAFNILLYQRNLLVMHASAVSVNGKAVAFLGHSGAGKSTTAAFFHAHGHPLVADDIVPVQVKHDRPTVFPAFPLCRLRPKSAEMVGVGDTRNVLHNILLDKIGLSKYNVCATSGFSEEPLDLQAIYVLSPGSAENVDFLRPTESLLELLRHSGIHARSGHEMLRRMGKTTSRLHDCSKVVRCTPVHRVSYPDILDSAGFLMDLVSEHLGDI